jgi:hypothetical protein
MKLDIGLGKKREGNTKDNEQMNFKKKCKKWRERERGFPICKDF